MEADTVAGKVLGMIIPHFLFAHNFEHLPLPLLCFINARVAIDVKTSIGKAGQVRIGGTCDMTSGLLGTFAL